MAVNTFLRTDQKFFGFCSGPWQQLAAGEGEHYACALEFEL